MSYKSCTFVRATQLHAYKREAHEDGDTDKCAKTLATIAGNISGDATLHARVADSFMRDGLLEEAADEYRKAACLAPGFSDVRCKLGRVLIALGRPAEALDQLREALRINPTSADAYAQVGLAYRLLGEWARGHRRVPEGGRAKPRRPKATRPNF